MQTKISGVPRPGMPPEYPIYLKPIQINTRDVLDELRKYTDESEPRVARWLYSTWEAEAEPLKYQEIRNALATGQIPQELIDQWQQDYSRFVVEVLQPEWVAAMTAAGERIAKQIPRAIPGPGEPFFFTTTGERITSWIEQRGGELAVNLSREQHAALRTLLKQYTTVEPLPVEEVARRIRPIIGLTEREALAVEAFRAELAKEGILSPVKLEKRVQDYAARLHRLRARRIALNETAIAFKQGQRESMLLARDQGWFGAQLWKEWCTAEDERVCPRCGPMDGVRVPFDEVYPELGVMTSHAHVSCMLPGTFCKPAGIIIAATRADYIGPVCEIELSCGSKVSVTGNHVFLTPFGFAGANTLRKGDYIISASSFERPSASSPNSDNSPSTIEDIFESIRDLVGSVSSRVPITAIDLHGDGQFVNGNIDIVRPDSFLLSDVKSSSEEPIFQDDLRTANMGAIQLFGFGDLATHFKALALAADCIMSCSREFYALHWREFIHSYYIRLASISERNTDLRESCCDDSSANIEFFRKCENRFSLKVMLFNLFKRDNSPQCDIRHTSTRKFISGFTDSAIDSAYSNLELFSDLLNTHSRFMKIQQIKSIRKFTFNGHVYDLQTDSTLYTCNNIMSSNCRCSETYSVEPRS